MGCGFEVEDQCVLLCYKLPRSGPEGGTDGCRWNLDRCIILLPACQCRRARVRSSDGKQTWPTAASAWRLATLGKDLTRKASVRLDRCVFLLAKVTMVACIRCRGNRFGSMGLLVVVRENSEVGKPLFLG